MRYLILNNSLIHYKRALLRKFSYKFSRIRFFFDKYKLLNMINE